MSHSTRTCPRAFTFLLLAVTVFLLPASSRAGFQTELVTQGGFFSNAVAFDMHVDTRGRVHVVYQDDVAGETVLVYGIRGPGGWIREQVTSTTGFDGAYAADLLVEEDGTVHVITSEDGALELLLTYYRRDDGVWTSTVLESQNGWAISPVIVRDGRTGELEVYALESFGSTVYRFEQVDGVWEAGVPAFVTGGSHDVAYGIYPFRYQLYEGLTGGEPRMFESNGATGRYLYLAEAGEFAVGATDIAIGPEGRAHVAGVVSDSLGRIRTFYHHEGRSRYFLPTNESGLDIRTARLAVDGRTRVHLFTEAATSTSTHGGDAEEQLVYLLRDDDFWSVQAELSKQTRPVAVDTDPQGSPHVLAVHSGAGYQLLTAGLFLDSPVGGEVLPAGGRIEIEWFGAGPVDVELATDGGSSWLVIARGASGGRAVVTLPPVATDEARMRVVRTEPYAVSTSPGDFTIAEGLADGWTTTPVTPAETGAAVDAVDLEVAPDGSVHAV